MATQVSDDNFEQEVMQSDKLVLVDFWAEWCGPCKQLGPIIDELATEMSDKVSIYKMNVDENPTQPSKLGIRGIPTMILFKSGKQIDVKVGVFAKPVIQEWIESHL